jgi:hypothetical protein
MARNTRPDSKRKAIGSYVKTYRRYDLREDFEFIVYMGQAVL